MANPKKKHTRMRRNMRRAANWAISGPNLSRCTNCGNSKISHRVCPECGFYNGELIVAKKMKKKKEGEEGGTQS